MAGCQQPRADTTTTRPPSSSYATTSCSTVPLLHHHRTKKAAGCLTGHRHTTVTPPPPPPAADAAAAAAQHRTAPHHGTPSPALLDLGRIQCASLASSLRPPVAQCASQLAHSLTRKLRRPLLPLSLRGHRSAYGQLSTHSLACSPAQVTHQSSQVRPAVVWCGVVRAHEARGSRPGQPRRTARQPKEAGRQAGSQLL